MHYTIYKTTNLVNNKIYIGKHQTTDLDDGYLGSGKNLRRSIKKYGVENFKKEILFVFDNELDMNTKEAELVTSEFILREDTYNLCIGGQGGFSHLNDGSSNHIERARKAGLKGGLGWANKSKGTTLSDERKRKLSDAQYESYRNGRIPPYSFLGKKHSEESKALISEKNSLSQLGSKNSQFGTMWITNGEINRKIKKDLDTIPEGWYRGRK